MCYLVYDYFLMTLNLIHIGWGQRKLECCFRPERAGYALPDQVLRKIIGVGTCGLHLEQFLRQDYLGEQM